MKYKIITIFFLVLVSCHREGKNPREMNGKTILRTADSVYFITFKIDSMIEMEYEPVDRPD